MTIGEDKMLHGLVRFGCYILNNSPLYPISFYCFPIANIKLLNDIFNRFKSNIAWFSTIIFSIIHHAIPKILKFCNGFTFRAVSS